MTMLFGLITAVSLVYWLVLMLYTGFSLSQSWIWLFFALAAAVNCAAAAAYRRDTSFLSLRFLTSIHTVAFAGMAAMLAAGAFIGSGMHPPLPVNPDYVVVLGAEVKPDGTLSKSLKRRLDRTLEFAEQNPGSVLVLSGGQGRKQPRSEAEFMADYLVSRGVPPARLRLEIQSKNTFENLRYSRALIERLESEKRGAAARRAGLPDSAGPILTAEAMPTRIAVLSSDYHLFRAVRLAKREFGFPVNGISVRTDPLLFPHFFFRECIALLKDQFFGRL